MKIAIVGLGHTGAVYSGCLTELGNHIIGIDEDKKIVENLKRGIPPLPEPLLTKTINKSLKNGRLKYFSDFKNISSCEVVWITIDTPFDKNAKGNLEKVFSYIKKVLPFMKNRCLLIVSSQIPIGTSSKILELLETHKKNYAFDYAYIPENLRLGEAIDTFMKPSRIVIGVNSDTRNKDLSGIFKKLRTKIIFVKVASAEMIKHATNAYLATSVSFIHDISDLCEEVNADITEVAKALRGDNRIGEKAYVNANLGFSGGHLERELQYLREVAKTYKVNIPVINSVYRKNEDRKHKVFKEILPFLRNYKGKTICFWGVTYKKGTPTLSHSLSVILIKRSLKLGAKIQICDSTVSNSAIQKVIPKSNIPLFKDPYLSAKNSNAIICMTPWNQLREVNFKRIAKQMVEPKIFFDAENFFHDERHAVEEAGIKYIGVGQ